MEEAGHRRRVSEGGHPRSRGRGQVPTAGGPRRADAPIHPDRLESSTAVYQPPPNDAELWGEHYAHPSAHDAGP